MTATASLLYEHLGRADRRWLYRNAEGERVGAALRWETDSGKVIRPVALIDGEWCEAAMPEPRPLFQLPELLASPELPVVVVEGESATDAAQAALESRAVVTTWAGGCGAVARTDWTPLAGRDVRVWPDADEPGDRAGRHVAAYAWAAGAASIERLRVPEDWPDGHDAADLDTETVRSVWADLAMWEELDVGAAVERSRSRQRARRTPRPRTATSPSPSWERRVEAARRIPIVDIARMLGCGDPVKRGRELHVRCPLHADSDPSCRLDSDSNVWFCDPCAEGGDAIGLYMRARRLDFVAAVKELAA